MDLSRLPSNEIVKKTAAALAMNGIDAHVVDLGKEALEKIKTWIPAGASVMNGSSLTLEEIGFVDYFRSTAHAWKNLHEPIFRAEDEAQKYAFRQQAALADFYVGSVHALTETGEFVVASQSGSQLPNIVYTSPNCIFVVSTKKIVSTLPRALERLEQEVFPRWNERFMAKRGVSGKIEKLLIFRGESASTRRKMRMILVNEPLGF